MVWLSTSSQKARKSFLLVANRQDPLAPGDVADIYDHVGCEPESVIAIDGGTTVALDMGVRPDVIVGDMDSIDPGVVRELAAAGSEVVKFAAEKDETDTQLALELAYSGGCPSAIVLIQAGGRLDHLFGVIMAAYKYVDLGMDVRFVDRGFEAVLLRGPAAVDIHPDKRLYVSLIPVAGVATGIDLVGLKYPLSGASLGPGETRGISNETLGKDARVRFTSGWLLVTAIVA